MWFSAARRRPLRSNRAMISPVRLRAKASGLTRMSVRSMASGLPSKVAGAAARQASDQRRATAARQATGAGRATAPRSGDWLAAGRGLAGGAGDRLLGAGLTPAAGAPRGRWRRPDLGLAIRADLPGRIERAAARRTWVL